MNRPSRSVAAVCGLFGVFAATLAHQNAAGNEPLVVRYAIKATVVEKVDLPGIFPDVQLGDPVRGMLKFDATRDPDESYFSFGHALNLWTDYNHPSWFEVASMVIDNPRTGGETRFMNDLNGDYADTEVGNENEQNAPGGYDEAWFIAAQSVVSPSPLFTGQNPAVLIDLEKPPLDHQDLSLPTALNPDDWPSAKIAFLDVLHGDMSDRRIEADIYSLTPITTPLSPGDFNYDGAVDGQDYYRWQSSFGSMSDLYADGNRNGAVDAADYTVWRDHFGQSAGGGANVAVPEPSTLALAARALAPLALWRRRLWNLTRPSN